MCDRVVVYNIRKQKFLFKFTILLIFYGIQTFPPLLVLSPTTEWQQACNKKQLPLLF
jgi:hypothetical protein